MYVVTMRSRKRKHAGRCSIREIAMRRRLHIGCLLVTWLETRHIYMFRPKPITRRGFRGGKRIDPRPRKHRGVKLKDAACGLPMPTTLQLNVEGLHASKICVIRQLAERHKALVILLQETHCTNTDQLVIPHFTLAGAVLSRKHGLATFVHEKLKWTLADQSCSGSAIEWLSVDIDGVKIINVYKPPPSRFTPSAIPVFPHPSLYAGDFNCQHTEWGYTSISPDGERLVDWATKSDLVLLHNPKDAPSFFSGRWNKSRPGIREHWSEQLAPGQMRLRKVPQVTTSTFAYYSFTNCGPSTK